MVVEIRDMDNPKTTLVTLNDVNIDEVMKSGMINLSKLAGVPIDYKIKKSSTVVDLGETGKATSKVILYVRRRKEMSIKNYKKFMSIFKTNIKLPKLVQIALWIILGFTIGGLIKTCSTEGASYPKNTLSVDGLYHELDTIR